MKLTKAFATSRIKELEEKCVKFRDKAKEYKSQYHNLKRHMLELEEKVNDTELVRLEHAKLLVEVNNLRKEIKRLKA